MRTRDQISLESLYLKTKTPLNESLQNDTIFTSIVNLDLYDINPPSNNSMYYEIPQKVKVHYQLNVEYGSAGISGIYAKLVNIEPIKVERITYTEGGEDVEEVEDVEIDLSNASFYGTVASDDQGQVIASAIEIHLDENNSARQVELVF